MAPEPRDQGHVLGFLNPDTADAESISRARILWHDEAVAGKVSAQHLLQMLSLRPSAQMDAKFDPVEDCAKPELTKINDRHQHRLPRQSTLRRSGRN
jgi:hypothetical protein